ncbi:hypothetical protein BC628DRAFT_679844 [Trametes gibbosa]|nr:hypothetical protein BC628DRAFT_679844 [Trametes gibbosa]
MTVCSCTTHLAGFGWVYADAVMLRGGSRLCSGGSAGESWGAGRGRCEEGRGDEGGVRTRRGSVGKGKEGEGGGGRGRGDLRSRSGRRTRVVSTHSQAACPPLPLSNIPRPGVEPLAPVASSPVGDGLHREQAARATARRRAPTRPRGVTSVCDCLPLALARGQRAGGLGL